MTGRELVELDEAWAATAVRGDVDAIMAFWTEDAVLYPEGQPPLYGKRAIREFIERRHSKPGYRISWTPSCAGIEPFAGMGYTLGEGAVTLVDDAGAATELNGRYVAIWQREDDAWRCAVKCWNSSPRQPPAGPRADP
jgi:ketosteroid isomerase-like protein